MDLDSRHKLRLKTWELQDLSGWGAKDKIYIEQASDFTNVYKIMTVLSAVREYNRETCHGLGIWACFLSM